MSWLMYGRGMLGICRQRVVFGKYGARQPNAGRHHLNRDENTNLYADTGYKDVEMNKDKDDD